jgi:putative sporulation protein YyaC
MTNMRLSGIGTNQWRINIKDDLAPLKLSRRLLDCICSLEARGAHMSVLCIGSDRCTGDSLGPLIGTKLAAYCTSYLKVYGTLENPVHAMNLPTVLQELQACNTTVLAIDACLGKTSTVGTIGANIGPLSPGAGVRKTLPPAGDLHITGIVNVKGFMEYAVLQNTRLYLVMKMADIISQAIVQALPLISQLFQENSVPSLLQG